MMLCDTGFIVAIISTRDNNHDRAMSEMAKIRYPVVTASNACVVRAS
jgi:predicted nucleic acid-binding protein